MGGENLVISGDKVKMEVDMGIKTEVQKFLILAPDAEALVMGFRGICCWSRSIVEIRATW